VDRRRSNATLAVVDALAVARVVRFLQQDTLIDKQRHQLQDWLARHGHYKAMELLDCPWCLSVHVAAAWTALRIIAPRLATPIGTALASSYAASALIEINAAIQAKQAGEPGGD
jgi:hypothetical protein